MRIKVQYLFFVIFNVLVPGDKSVIVDKYIKLINEEIARSKDFALPTDYSDFKPYTSIPRGNKADYDGWCKQENPGWCYKDVLPLFIKSENFEILDDIGYHGIGGNINVEYIKPDSPLLKAFIEGNSELGRKVVDYNGKAQLGVSKIQHDTIHGRRDSTGKAIACGVLFSHDKILYQAKALREVIVSAGAIDFPQLLMLSEIGPESHLRELGIPVIQPLPVGQNCTNLTVKARREQYLNGYGRLTKASNLEGLGFFQTLSEKTPGRPNIGIAIVPPSNSNGTEPLSFPLKQEYLEVLKTIDLTRTFKLGVALLRPKSRGVIKLRSVDPYNTNYLSREYWYCQIRQLGSHVFHASGTCKMGPDPAEGAVVDHELKVHGIKNLRVANASIMPEIISVHTSMPCVMIGEKLSEMLRD
ncbi:hypothetical protein ILUMI_19996 [Ignelater luminosus]|uniref:Uncharacterized protein n=1 Tax=Ignelater luminosus TaxID=2038154 RepID=A0A8K0CF41_IGNLU|nr:hypothetical protein ILUMI_19996 [Ignelater luminosus]